MTASRDSSAYQDNSYGRYDRHSRKNREIHEVTPSNSRQSAFRAAHFAVIVLVAAVAALIVYNYMVLTTLTDQVSTKKQTLKDLSSEYTYLKAKQERMLNLTYVEEYAQTKLNMMKMDKNQAEYIELSNPDHIEVSGSEDNIGHAVAGFVKSFNAVLEYLK